jgi:hypothetical protein
MQGTNQAVPTQCEEQTITTKDEEQVAKCKVRRNTKPKNKKQNKCKKKHTQVNTLKSL